MRVVLAMPADIEEQENPFRNAEMPAVPQVGDLVGYSDQGNYLVVESVAWEVQRGEFAADLADAPTVKLAWAQIVP